MGVEAFAEAALALLPDWHVEAIEDVNFLAPFKFYRHEQRALTVEAVLHPQANSIVADCRLIGHRSLPNQIEPQTTIHFTGRVRLAKQSSKKVSGKALKPEGNIIEAADIYALYFHGPAYQVVQKAWWDGKRIVGLLSDKLPANHHPAELLTHVGPRLIELCFQTAGICEMGIDGRMGLPLHIDRLIFSPQIAEVPNQPLYAVVTRKPEQSSFDAEVVDASGNCYVRLSGYHTVSVAGAIDPSKLKALQAAMTLDLVAA
jgi:hypothetical protein